MGLFDRIADDHVLMDLPELYKHGRNGEYFNLKLFLIYLLDGAYQVSFNISCCPHRFRSLCALVSNHILLCFVRVLLANLSY